MAQNASEEPHATPCIRRLSAEAHDLITRAEAVRHLPSTRSDFADALARGIALTARGEAAGQRLLRWTLADVAAFRHIVHEDGDFYLSMYARGLIDSAQWALESRSTSPADAERLREGIRLLGIGDERGIRLLEDSPSE